MTTQLEEDKLSPLDSAFLDIETPTHLMTICGLYLIDESLTRDDLKKEFENFVVDYPRFRKRIAHSTLHDRSWEDYDFNLDDHVVVEHVEQPGRQEQLEELSGRILSTPFDMKKALWQAHLILGLENGRSAILTRMHHCITDGQGSVRTILSLMKPLKGNQTLQHTGSTPPPKPKSLFSKIIGLPFRLLFFIWSLLIMTLRGLYVTLYSNKSFANTEATIEKKVSWTEISLTETKTIKNHFKCTLNDILLAILSGALRNYILRQNLPLENDLLCGVPVSLRTKEDWSLTNKSVIIWEWLPAETSDPIKRLQIIQKRMTERKKSPEASLNHLFIVLLTKLIPSQAISTYTNVLEWYMDKYHALMTNVPGPASLLTFSGRTINSYVALIPQPGRNGFGITIMSYADKIGFSVLYNSPKDPNQTSPAKILVEEFQKEFQMYSRLVNESPP